MEKTVIRSVKYRIEPTAARREPMANVKVITRLILIPIKGSGIVIFGNSTHSHADFSLVNENNQGIYND